MTNIQVRNVPDDVHQILSARAAAAGQSLQAYLLAWLTAEARSLTIDDVLSRASRRAGGSMPLSVAAALLREDRDRIA